MSSSTFFFFKQKTAYEMPASAASRRRSPANGCAQASLKTFGPRDDTGLWLDDDVDAQVDPIGDGLAVADADPRVDHARVGKACRIRRQDAVLEHLQAYAFDRTGERRR